MSLLVKESKNFPPTFLKESRQRTFTKISFLVCAQPEASKKFVQPRRGRRDAAAFTTPRNRGLSANK